MPTPDLFDPFAILREPHREWQVATDLKIRWQEDGICFDCPCGENELIVNDEPKKCRCGRWYHPRHFILVSYEDVADA